jgi:hypothetical protein
MNKVGNYPSAAPFSKTQATASVATKTTGLNKLPPGHPDYKLQLSDQSRELQNQMQQETSSSTNSSSSSNSTMTNSTSADVPTPPKVEVPDLKVEEVIDKASKAKQVKDAVDLGKLKLEEAKAAKTPAVFYIRGVEFFETAFTENGLRAMAESTEGARYYAWDQKEQMVEQIKKRDKNQPVILIGHGFGADTAVEVAQALNTVENNFRKVDLLVTLNARGANNDFIPQNVVKNLNFLPQNNSWYDDGPNIALNYQRTSVENFLRAENHGDLPNSTDIQIEIMDAINKLI